MKTKKILAMFLAIAIAIGLLPSVAIADDSASFNIGWEVYKVGTSIEDDSIDMQKPGDIKNGNFKTFYKPFDYENDTLAVGDIFLVAMTYENLGSLNFTGIDTSMINIGYDYSMVNPTLAKVNSATDGTVSINSALPLKAIVPAASDGKYSSNISDINIEGDTKRAQLFGMTRTGTVDGTNVMNDDRDIHYLGLFEFQVVAPGSIVLEMQPKSVVTDASAALIGGFTDSNYTTTSTTSIDGLIGNTLSAWPSVTLMADYPPMDPINGANISITDSTGNEETPQKTVTITAAEASAGDETSGGTLREGTIYTVYAPDPDDSAKTIVLGTHIVTSGEVAGDLTFTLDPLKDDTNYDKIVAALNKGGPYQVTAQLPDAYSESSPVTVEAPARTNYITSVAGVAGVADADYKDITAPVEVTVNTEEIDSTNTNPIPSAAKLTLTYDPETGYQTADVYAYLDIPDAVWKFATGNDAKKISGDGETIAIQAVLEATSNSENGYNEFTVEQVEKDETTGETVTKEYIVVNKDNAATLTVSADATVVGYQITEVTAGPIAKKISDVFDDDGTTINDTKLKNVLSGVEGVGTLNVTDPATGASTVSITMNWDTDTVTTIQTDDDGKKYIKVTGTPTGVDFTNVSSLSSLVDISSLPTDTVTLRINLYDQIGAPNVTEDTSCVVKHLDAKGLIAENSKVYITELVISSSDGTTTTESIQENDIIRVYDDADKTTLLGSYTATKAEMTDDVVAEIPIGTILAAAPFNGEDTVVYLETVRDDLTSDELTQVPLKSWNVVASNVEIVNGGKDASSTITIKQLTNGTETKNFSQHKENKANVEVYFYYNKDNEDGTSTITPGMGLDNSTKDMDSISGDSVAVNDSNELVITLPAGTFAAGDAGKAFYITIKEGTGWVESDRQESAVTIPASGSEVAGVVIENPNPNPGDPDDPKYVVEPSSNGSPTVSAKDVDKIDDAIAKGTASLISSPIVVLVGTSADDFEAMLPTSGIPVYFTPAIVDENGTSTNVAFTGASWDYSDVTLEAVGQYEATVTLDNTTVNKTNVNVNGLMKIDVYVVKAPEITLKKGNATAKDVADFANLGVAESSVFVFYQYGFMDPGFTVTDCNKATVTDPSVKVYTRLMPVDDNGDLNPDAEWTGSNAGTEVGDTTAAYKFEMNAATDFSKKYQIRYVFTDSTYQVECEAVRNVYVIYLLGDVDMTGGVDYADGSLLTQYTMQLAKLVGISADVLYEDKVANVDQNGGVDYADGSLLTQYTMQLAKYSQLYAADGTNHVMTFTTT